MRGPVDAAKARAFRAIANLSAPPRMHVGPVWANRLGLQYGRVLWRTLLFSLRHKRTDPAVAPYLATLDRKGIVLIPDFLPQDAFDRLEKALDTWAATDARVDVNRNGTGVTWITGVPDPATEAAEGFDLLATDRRLLSIASAVMRRPVTRRPEPRYQELRVEPGLMDDRDRECIIHADRHYPTVKAYLTINENTVAGGAYVFYPGSHKLTAARLRHEYDFSVREALHRRGTRLPDAVFVGGRNVPSAANAAAMGLEEEHIVCRKNTLVISNNMAFHRRGTLQPGNVRKQIRLVFHFLEEPWYAKFLRRLTRRRTGHST